jgi:alanine racemase
MEMADPRPVQWIEIEGDALDHNLGLFRRIINADAALLAVVKANAYGHGLAQVATRAVRHASWLGVHSANEARQLREIGLEGPILVMGFVPPSDFCGLDSDVHLMVSEAQSMEWVRTYRQQTGVALPVHIKVDIGTKRQGVSVADLPKLITVASNCSVEVVGIASHYANIEDTIEYDFARLQMERFRKAVDVARRELGEFPPFIHASCSASALLFRETDFSLVRVGISMYGHWPSRETRLSWTLEHSDGGVQLRPALSWKAIVGQLQAVEKDASVGYGRTWTARRDSLLAVIPVGYADGYLRALGNRARVLIHGRSAPVVGRVCMNILMADTTDIPDVSVGDEAVLIGRQGDEHISVEELALLGDTINYELLARLSPAIPRTVV